MATSKRDRVEALIAAVKAEVERLENGPQASNYTGWQAVLASLRRILAAVEAE